MHANREDKGDEWWFPCALHFAQLAMHEAVAKYSKADEDRNFSGLPFHYTDHQDVLRDAVQRGTYLRLTSTSRAIQTAIKSANAYSSLFQRHQKPIGIIFTI